MRREILPCPLTFLDNEVPTMSCRAPWFCMTSFQTFQYHCKRHLCLRRAVRDFAGAKLAQLLLFLLCCSAGMFAAASAFLPSSFVMYTLTLAAAAVIDNHPRGVIAYGAIAVLLGWPVAGTHPAAHALLHDVGTGCMLQSMQPAWGRRSTGCESY